MAVIRNLVVKITADIGELTKSLNTAQTKLNKAAGVMGSIGSTLTTSITLPLAAIGGVAVSTAAQFEQSMANAASVSSATSEEFEEMTALAREMGKTTVFSASQAADAMYYMASAGYKVEQMANTIAPVLDLAAATQSELAFTTDTVISTLNQFNLDSSEASRVTNTFAAVIGSSQATLDKLANSMRYAGPVANSLGYSVEETAAALGLLYNAGFKGEQAGTVLRAALSRLVDPTKAMTDTLTEMHLSFEDINPETNEFSDIIAKLEGASISTAQAVSLFGTEAGPGMMALISKGSNSLIEMEGAITGTSAASVMAQRQLDTFQGSMKLMQSQAEEISITLGNILIPIMNDFMQYQLTPLIYMFGELSEESQMLAVKIGLIAAAIGPLFMGISKILKLMATFVQIAGILSRVISSGFSAIGTALSFVAKGFGLLFTPVGLVVLAVVAAVAILTAAFIHFYKTNESFKAQADGIWEKMKGIFAQIVGIIQQIGGIFMQVFEKLAPKLMALFETIMVVVASLLEFLMPIISTLLDVILTHIMNVLDAFLPVIEKVLSAVGSLFSAISKLIAGDFTGAWEDFKDFFVSLWEGILLFLKGIVNVMISLVNGFLSLIGAGLNSLIGGINQISIDVPDWVPVIGGKEWGFSIGEISMPQIPKLAKGGVIPPNDEFLAILGDQKSGTNIEAPLDTMVTAFKVAAKDISANKSNSQDIKITFDGTWAALIKLLAPKITQEQRKMGVIK